MCMTNKSCITKLFQVCHFMLILPPNDEKSKVLLNIFRCCSGLYILMATGMFTWSTMFSTFVDLRVNPIFDVLTKLSQAALHFSASIVVLKLTFFKEKLYKKFLVKLWKTNDKLVSSWLKSRGLVYIFLPFYLGVFLCFFRSYYEACTQMECMVNSVYLLEQFQRVQSLLVVSVAISSVQCLNNQYIALINKLSSNQYKRTQKIQAIKFEGSIQVIEEINTVEDIIYIHEQMCDLIDNFNTIFGSNILMVVLSGTINILIYATRLAQYILEDSGQHPDQFDAGRLIEMFFYVSLAVVLPIILADRCSEVVSRGKQLVVGCLSYSNQLSLRPNTYEDELLEKSISILLHQAERRIPQFSAGGFFPIDYSMLKMIASSLTANMEQNPEIFDCTKPTPSLHKSRMIIPYFM